MGTQSMVPTLFLDSCPSWGWGGVSFHGQSSSYLCSKVGDEEVSL